MTDRITRFASNGSARIAYTPPSRSGAPLTLGIHDLLADRRWFERQQIETDGDLVSIDLRGHGASGAMPDREFLLDDLVADAIAVSNAESMDQFALIAVGYVALIGLRLAAENPSVTTITLIDPVLLVVPPFQIGNSDRDAIEYRIGANQQVARKLYGGQTAAGLADYLDEHHGADWQHRLPPIEQATARRHAASLTRLLPALERASAEPLPSVSLATIRVLQFREPDAISRATLQTLQVAYPSQIDLCESRGVDK